MALLLPASATAQDAGSPSAAPAAAEVNPRRPTPMSRSSRRAMRAKRVRAVSFGCFQDFNADSQNSMCLLLEAAARANGLPVEFFTRVICRKVAFAPMQLAR